MTETAQLINTLKRLLKSQGMTYRDVAEKLGLSEPSVKRLFSSRRFTVDRLIQVSNLLGYTLAELAGESVVARAQLDTLTELQEREVVSDPKLLIVAVCALNHWKMEEITSFYQLETTECLKYLLRLDKLRIIDLLPGNRIRINVSRDFNWLPDGPIQQYFQQHGQGEFLHSKFSEANETLSFTNGMFTEPALSQLQEELRRLRQKFVALHNESQSAPFSQRRGIGLLLAMRAWEPEDFVKLRR